MLLHILIAGTAFFVHNVLPDLPLFHQLVQIAINGGNTDRCALSRKKTGNIRSSDVPLPVVQNILICLLYTSDAADEL